MVNFDDDDDEDMIEDFDDDDDGDDDDDTQTQNMCQMIVVSEQSLGSTRCTLTLSQLARARPCSSACRTPRSRCPGAAAAVLLRPDHDQVDMASVPKLDRILFLQTLNFHVLAWRAVLRTSGPRTTREPRTSGWSATCPTKWARSTTARTTAAARSPFRAADARPHARAQGADEYNQQGNGAAASSSSSSSGGAATPTAVDQVHPPAGLGRLRPGAERAGALGARRQRGPEDVRAGLHPEERARGRGSSR